MENNNHIYNNNNNNHHDIRSVIKQLTKFGYSINDILTAIKHTNKKRDTDITSIIKYLTTSIQRNNQINNNNNHLNHRLLNNNDENLNQNEHNIYNNQLLNEPSIKNLISSLPTEGYIKLHSSTSYWCISLGDEWQSQSVNIANLSYSFIKNSSEYRQSINMGKSWASMVNIDNPRIKCVTPPSVAGMFEV